MRKQQAVVTKRRGAAGPARAPAIAEGEIRPATAPWRLVRGGAVLFRSYVFPNPSVAASFSQVAVGLAAHARLPLFVRQVDASVILALRGEGGQRVRPLAAELFDRLASLS